MSEPFEHLHPDYRSVALLPAGKRIEWLRTERWIGFPKALAVLDRLQMLLDYPKRPRMPCLLIYGRSGMGKSMAIAKFLHAHPPVFDEKAGSTLMPVVSFQMPKEPLEEDFYEQLLKSVGITFKGAMSKREAGRLAMRMLTELGTRVLIIDEINSLLAGTARQQRLFLNLIRFITNELSLPIVCAGTPEAHRALLFDQHLADRFDALELTPWRAVDLQLAFERYLVAALNGKRIAQTWCGRASNAQILAVVDDVAHALCIRPSYDAEVLIETFDNDLERRLPRFPNLDHILCALPSFWRACTIGAVLAIIGRDDICDAMSGDLRLSRSPAQRWFPKGRRSLKWMVDRLHPADVQRLINRSQKWPPKVRKRLGACVH